MRNLFSYFLIFSWLVIYQQKLLAGIANELLVSSQVATHKHDHSLATAFAMILTGDLEHSHDHDEDSPLEGIPTHSSKSHSHSYFEGSNLTAEFLNPKAGFSFPPGAISEISSLESNIFNVEIQTKIFRPPIHSQYIFGVFPYK